MIRLLLATPLRPGPLAITGDDHHYLFRVRRLTLADRLVVCDGEGGEADATVTSIDAGTGWLELGPRRSAAPRRGPELVALLPLIKGERMDLALEKLVELGVAHIVPFAAARSVVRLDATRAAERHRRYRAIARAAATQCRTSRRCEVAPIGDLTVALTAAGAADLRLMFSEQAAAPSLRATLAASAPPVRVALLTGPEGGLTEDETAAAVAAGFVAVSLGPRILRAETAAITAAVAIAYALGDLGQ